MEEKDDDNLDKNFFFKDSIERDKNILSYNYPLDVCFKSTLAFNQFAPQRHFLCCYRI